MALGPAAVKTVGAAALAGQREMSLQEVQKMQGSGFV
jgi:hypothetical protein